MHGELIVLAGPAAVGKSTLAQALQRAFARQDAFWIVFQLDAFARSLPRDWISWTRRQGRLGHRGFTYAPADDGGIQLTIGEDARRFLAAFHRAAAAIVRSGVNVVCESIVYDEEDWADWRDALEGISARWIRLSAPLPVLEARENADPARIFRGLARGMMSRSPAGVFDLEFDTSVQSAEAIAARIAARTG